MIISRSKKAMLITIGAVIGGFLLAAAAYRAYKISSAQGATQTFMQAFQAQIQAISGFGVVIYLAAMAATVYQLMFGMGDPDGFIYANLVGVVASGVGTSTAIPTITTVHQFLWFEISTTPQSLKVNVNGDTLITDLDTNGLNVMKNARSKGVFTNGFLIQLATGLITNRNVDITVVNNVASAFNVFGISRRQELPGNERYVQSLGINLNASQSFDVVNFTYFGAPSLASADILNIYSSGRATLRSSPFSVKQELESSRGILQLYENQASALKSMAWDNYDQDIDRINIIPVAAQKIYVQRIVPAGAKVTASLVS